MHKNTTHPPYTHICTDTHVQVSPLDRILFGPAGPREVQTLPKVKLYLKRSHVSGVGDHGKMPIKCLNAPSLEKTMLSKCYILLITVFFNKFCSFLFSFSEIKSLC